MARTIEASVPVGTASDGHHADDATSRALALGESLLKDPALAALLATQMTGVCILSPEAVVATRNAHVVDLFGWSVGESLGYPDDGRPFHSMRLRQRQVESLRQHLAGELDQYAFESLMQRESGTFSWISLESTLVRDDAGAPHYFLMLIDDTIHRRTESRVTTEADERIQALLRNTPDVFGVVSPQGRLEFVSGAVERVLGYDPPDLLEADLLELVAPSERDRVVAEVQEALAQAAQGARFGTTIQHRDGSLRWMEVDFSLVNDERGLSGYVFSARDVTARRAAEEELQRLAYFDHLTALPNRVQFREQLDDALERVPPGKMVGVVFVDIDRFKAINDQFGHAAGDEVLARVGKQLGDAVHPMNLASRFGGDEFVILLRETTPEEAMHVANDLVQQLSGVTPERPAQPQLAVSAGVALWTTEMRTSRDLLHAADIALYASKSAGGGIVTHYDPALAVHPARAGTDDGDR